MKRVELVDIELTLGEKKILTSLNLDVGRGVNVFLGPNGAGKTLTNKIIGLLLLPSSGQILFDDHKINLVKKDDEYIQQIRKIGYMSQKPVFLKQNVEENVALPLKIRRIKKKDRKERVRKELREFNLLSLANKHPLKLSIGQRQKIALLRTLIHNPELLILDEPTSSLDLANIKWFEEYITMKKDGKIIFWTTHDQFQAKRLSGQVHIFIDGTILEKGSNQIFSNPHEPKVKSFLKGELL